MQIYLLCKTVMIFQITDQLVFCNFYENHLSVFYMSKQIAVRKIYSQNIREDFEKKLAPNIHY